ncbi:MAG: carboxymuconolactone decarboxylase family protein [Betaproteobacteria bacterium]|nr:carboxymuconolactone decarboxylase family protein [Betaproteobacteria bacterium]
MKRAKKKTAAAAKKPRATRSAQAKARAGGFTKWKRKYGAAAIESLARMHPDHVSEHIAWCDALDQNFTKLWLDFTYGGMARRGILDERTRCLVLVGQFLVMDEMEQFPIHIRNALRHATPREVLEVILQAAVYLGYPKIIRAARVFTKTLKELGRLGEITRTQLPIDGHKRGRSLEAERKTWGVTEADCPRREELLRKFGWEGLSTGFRLQPGHHHKTVEQLERVDPHFLKIWLDFIYAGMYVRGILDDRTRILCVIGELFVMGEFVQIENHIRNALIHGATPREVLEVILQSTIYAGMPRFVRVVALLQRVLEEDGRPFA